MSWYKKYIKYYEHPIEEMSQPYLDSFKERYEKFDSSEPIISIVIIAHNEERRILSCIDSLLDNKLPAPTELFVIDNNSTDHTTELLNRVGIRWYQEEKKGPGYARQSGLDRAKGKYYFCIDSDSLYPAQYISTHYKHITHKGVACTFSLWGFLPSKKYPKIYLFFFELIRDIFLIIQNIKRPELTVRGLAFAFPVKEGREIGFRKDIIRGEDGSLALELKKYGKLKFITSSKARIKTCTAIFDNQNGLSKAIMVRAKKAFKSFGGLFTQKKNYKDQESNLIDKK